jgi:hypothetical protein
MFWIRYKDTANGSYTTMTLSPGPTTVSYPEKRDFKVQVTPDGAVVVSRPMRDSRPRRWIWKRYRPWIATYENQWMVLESLEYRTRLLAGKYPIVEIWEDESTIGGFDGMVDASTKKWTKAKFLRVERTVNDSGGPVIYEESFIEFMIDDTSWGAF